RKGRIAAPAISALMLKSWGRCAPLSRHKAAPTKSASLLTPSAPQQGTTQSAITPQIRRQKIDTPPLIAKRHKTVRSFFDYFFKIFFDAGIKISRNSFALYISGQNPRVLSD
ncbi:hypothetical protein NJH24_20310, partial [Pseudomonas asiatica]|uniref:hypothetical protein n=1 Tax=Pseudomonas asiatica TaxID=2219225 RepID=UPI00209A6F4A